MHDQSYYTCVTPILPIKLNENIFNLHVPSKFFYEWLEEHYIKLLKIALQKELGKDAKLVYSIVMDQKYSGKDPYTVRIPSSNKEKLQPQEIDAPLPIDSKKVKNPFVIPGLQKIKIDSQLNTSNNFSNFIEGETNRLADRKSVV